MSEKVREEEKKKKNLKKVKKGGGVMERIKIEKLMEVLGNGELIRGTYQRTPRHDLKKSREIMGDILKNK